MSQAHEAITEAESLQERLGAWAQAEALGLAMGGLGGPAPWGLGRFLAIASPEGPVAILDLLALGGPGPLAELLQSPRPIKAWAKALVPATWLLASWGQSQAGLFDAGLASQLLGEGARADSPNSLCEGWLGRSLPLGPAGPEGGQLRGEAGPVQGLEGLPSSLEAWAPALVAEARAALSLRSMLRPRLLEGGLIKVASLEFALVPCLAALALRGVGLDSGAWRARVAVERGERAGAAAEARRLLALGSGPLGQSALFEAEDLPGMEAQEDRALASTPTVKAALSRLGLDLPDTADGTLAQHADHPAVAALRRWRQLHHAGISYGEAFLKHLHPQSQRLHPEWHQLASASGRMSTSHPNLQALPRAEAYRRAVVPAPGHTMIVADYSQIELRILADRAHERTMIAAFEQGEDLHRAAASELFWCPIEAVTAEQRRRAKGVLFGLVYGQGPRGMAEALGLPIEEAQALVTRTHERFPRLKVYLEAAGRAAQQGEAFRSALGRRALSKPADTREHQGAMERFGRNFPIQSSCADLLKLAMLRAERDLAPLGAHLVLSVHDELVAEVPTEHAEEAAAVLREAMLDEATKVLSHAPAEVELAVADHWGKA